MPNSDSATQKPISSHYLRRKTNKIFFEKKIDFRQLVEKNAKILFFDLGVKNLL
jgi:hypothetical protein